jgi:membrane protease YdiL (CAAX protease family)
MFVFLIILGGGSAALGVPAEIGLAQLGPGIASLLMLTIFRQDGHQMTFFNRKTPWQRYGYVVLIMLGGTAVIYVLSQFLKVAGTDTSYATASLPLLLLWMPFGALGEEIGWRGYLHKYLDGRFTGIVSSLIVGLLWATMHVHFFQNGPVFMAFFALLMISYTIVMYALLHDTGFDVLLASFFHLMINLTSLLFLDRVNGLAFMIVYSLVWTAVAAITLWLKKDQFFATKTALLIEQG